jgi:hypothetical protein
MKSILENFETLRRLTSAPAVGDQVAVETSFGFQNDRRIGTVSAVLSSHLQDQCDWCVVVRFPRTQHGRATKKYLRVHELRVA